MDINKLKGYVIVRFLIDDDGVKKPFTFYPREKGGIPPYFYKSKEKAMNVWKHKKGIFKGTYFDPKDTAVVKFKKEMYLDRY